MRRANFYGITDRNVTPYDQIVTDNVIRRILDELAAVVRLRRPAARRSSPTTPRAAVIRKGLALTPVKFGISFTATFNQASALVNVYTDGTVHLTTAAPRWARASTPRSAGRRRRLPDRPRPGEDHRHHDRQGAEHLGDRRLLRLRPQRHGGAERRRADQGPADRLRRREILGDREQVVFEPNRVLVGNRRIAFDDLIKEAYLGRVHLSAAGFYKTPEIHWDRAAGKGRPFYYFAYGAACSEVSVDTLTGEYHVDRTDILHDVGRSLNPAIDKGQVEGAFIQGIGWLTTEELWWDDKGRLRTHAPSTYKIPLASDRPAIFNVRLADWSENREPTIRRSKAVGEPPFMLGVSVLEALSMAVASVADYRTARASTPRRRPSAS